jgi:molybdopterin synthase catalytic subunit/molybdopterin converting factor small subunit
MEPTLRSPIGDRSIAVTGDVMRLEVRTFGGLAERAGLATLVVELPEGADVAMLRRVVAAQHPELAPLMHRVAVSVDLELAGDATPLRAGTEVALLPPVAGGSDDAGGGGAPVVVTGLVHGPLDVEGTIARIGAPDVGAVVSFLGTVRDHAEDLDGVVRLEYSAYEPMAERELALIADEITAAHPAVRGLALLHALGELGVGAHTILVAVASPHRAEAFTACREALEAVKARVPVFKREVTADGAHRWVGLPDDRAGSSGDEPSAR